MDKQIKWIGAAMVIGGLLMFTRMAPIFAILPDDMTFPPATTRDMVRLAEIAGHRWQLSHLMGLFAVALFAVAYGWHVRVLMRLGWKRIGMATAAIATAAFGLFGIALIIDGFVVSGTIQRYRSTSGTESSLLAQVAELHSLALTFFTPAIFLLFVVMGVLSSPMLHGRIHSRWLGVAGQVIAVTAVTAYLTNMAGPHWNNLQIAGTLMMAAFAWHLLVGTRSLFLKPAVHAD